MLRLTSLGALRLLEHQPVLRVLPRREGGLDSALRPCQALGVPAVDAFHLERRQPVPLPLLRLVAAASPAPVWLEHLYVAVKASDAWR